jgi:hypothetical protein
LPDSGRFSILIRYWRPLHAFGWTVLGALLAFVTVWAFMGYLSPDRVLDFASFLQMCGIPMSR